MGQIITALEPQKRRRDRISVFLDGEFAFGLPVVAALVEAPDPDLPRDRREDEAWIGDRGQRRSVGGQHRADALELTDPFERPEELGERIDDDARARDVRRDRRQHVITGDEQTTVGIPQAQGVDGVARGVERNQLPAGQATPAVP